MCGGISTWYVCNRQVQASTWWPYEIKSMRAGVSGLQLGGIGAGLACKQVCSGHHMATLGTSRHVKRHAHVTVYQSWYTAGMQSFAQPSNYWHWNMVDGERVYLGWNMVAFGHEKHANRHAQAPTWQHWDTKVFKQVYPCHQMMALWHSSYAIRHAQFVCQQMFPDHNMAILRWQKA